MRRVERHGSGLVRQCEYSTSDALGLKQCAIKLHGLAARAGKAAGEEAGFGCEREFDAGYGWNEEVCRAARRRPRYGRAILTIPVLPSVNVTLASILPAELNWRVTPALPLVVLSVLKVRTVLPASG